MTTQSFYQTVMDVSEEPDPEVVGRSTAAVLQALRDRLTPAEADQVRAQLPTELKDVWGDGEVVARKPLELDREQFYALVAKDAGLPSRREARWMTLAVFAALQEQLSPGEADDVLAQLPGDLKEVWTDAHAAPAEGDRAERAEPVRVQDVMSPDPITIDPSAPLGTARAVMAEKDVRQLPVIDDTGRLIGIVTDRDLRSAAVAPALAEHLSASARRRLRTASEALENLRVRDVMTWSVVTASPEMPLAQAAAIMLEGRIGSLPVVVGGTLVGIVTERDALRSLAATLAAVRGGDPDTYFW